MSVCIGAVECLIDGWVDGVDVDEAVTVCIWVTWKRRADASLGGGMVRACVRVYYIIYENCMIESYDRFVFGGCDDQSEEKKLIPFM